MCNVYCFKLAGLFVYVQLDLEKMPLGKISRKQIMDAYGVLNETLKGLKASAEQGSNRMLVDVTNRFYTTIPHNFGLSQPPLLNSEKIIQVITAWFLI